MNADDLTDKRGKKVIYRGRLSVIDTAPSYTLQTVGVLNDFDGLKFVNIAELMEVDGQMENESK
jgi:hypothetical protein